MNDIRVNALIESYFNGTLEGEDRASLERTLLASAQARELFCRKAEIHEALQAWGSEHWDSLADVLASADRRPARFRWLAEWASHLRSATAAAFAVAISLSSVLGAGVALVFGGQSWPMTRVAVPIANGGFEQGASNFDASCVAGQRLERLPDRFGVWAGDGVRPCGAERGVQPMDGRSMVAFEKALSGPGDPGVTRADSCDLFQLVDLTPYRELIAHGGCVLTLTSKVFEAPDPEGSSTTYVISLHVFGGSPQTVVEGWPRGQPLTMNQERLYLSQSQAAGWRDLSTRVFLPTDATFAVVQLASTSMDRTPGRPSAEFDRHYYDAVRLTLDAPKGKAAKDSVVSAQHRPPVTNHASAESP